MVILAVTVVAFASIVVLALAGHAVAASVISAVWATTCGVLRYIAPRGSRQRDKP
ncbi:hypothetical protein [Kribbella sp. NPDC004875]|uniref:hypothetical protein n=1 Tax=Kribbella sp. NPDC004875 TaxID=3364107 RepID=UPI00368D6A9D